MTSTKITISPYKALIQSIKTPHLSPPMYHVILFNDDYTPMEFVVDVLKRFFFKDEITANQLMLQIHTQGKAICGTYTYEIAETKHDQVTHYAKIHQHPLACTLESVK